MLFPLSRSRERAGVRARATRPRATKGGHKAAFLLAPRPGPTFRHADGRDALVDALRSGGWVGTATITLSSVSPSSTLAFESTADGKATSTGGPSQRRTTNDLDDWAQEFLEAWDASAG